MNDARFQPLRLDRSEAREILVVMQNTKNKELVAKLRKYYNQFPKPVEKSGYNPFFEASLSNRSNRVQQR